MKRPGPAVLAAATLPFLFDYSFTIYGGNLFSTLAGEYAYSLSIALGLVFLGLFARGVRTGRTGDGRPRARACIAAHIIPACSCWSARRSSPPSRSCPSSSGPTTPWPAGAAASATSASGHGHVAAPLVAASTVVLGLLLSGWWLVPFGLRQPYTTTMATRT